jgi:hypothetical protein
MAAPLDYVRPELFDEAVVATTARTLLSAVLGRPLGAIRCRTTRTAALAADIPAVDSKVRN